MSKSHNYNGECKQPFCEVCLENIKGIKGVADSLHTLSTPQTPSPDKQINGLDDAVRKFREYCQENGDFDELDFKEWLIDTYAAKCRREGEIEGRIDELAHTVTKDGGRVFYWKDTKMVSSKVRLAELKAAKEKTKGDCAT